ncbi:MAG TPA: hypothetical protein QGH28_07160 [Chloroflexota bacterium]|nr:hypothetical protein [Chloroflexota bacterium]
MRNGLTEARLLAGTGGLAGFDGRRASHASSTTIPSNGMKVHW